MDEWLDDRVPTIFISSIRVNELRPEELFRGKLECGRDSVSWLSVQSCLPKSNSHIVAVGLHKLVRICSNRHAIS